MRIRVQMDPSTKTVTVEEELEMYALNRGI